LGPGAGTSLSCRASSSPAVKIYFRSEAEFACLFTHV
jgi:hypothetical protein